MVRRLTAMVYYADNDRAAAINVALITEVIPRRMVPRP